MWIYLLTNIDSVSVPVEPVVAVVGALLFGVVVLIICFVGVDDDFVSNGVTEKKYNNVEFYLRKIYMLECQKMFF